MNFDSSGIKSTREHVSLQLAAYGEDEASRRVRTLNDEAFEFVEAKALDIACEVDPENPMAHMLLDKALALAAIFVLEGVRRPLKRKRRRYQ
jgi:hypothetical protein